MNNKTSIEHLVKFPEILGKLETTSSQDLITENAINQAKEMKTQTAVEWLQERLLLSLSDELKSLNGFFVIAKEMEKEQHKETWFASTSQFDNSEEMTYEKRFVEYYNETYKKEEK